MVLHQWPSLTYTIELRYRDWSQALCNLTSFPARRLTLTQLQLHMFKLDPDFTVFFDPQHQLKIHLLVSLQDPAAIRAAVGSQLQQSTNPTDFGSLLRLAFHDAGTWNAAQQTGG